MKRLLFLHPYIFSICSAIILYVGMLDVSVYISPWEVILPTLWAIVICLILVLIAYLFARETKIAAVIASLFVLGLLHLWYIFVAVTSITVLGIIIIRIFRKKVDYQDVNLILSLISVFMFGFYLYKFLEFVFAQPSLQSRPVMTQQVMAAQKIITSRDQFPDIYYIILDGYGRADVLQTIHGYDNSAFIAALEQRGFIVAPESQANYSRTLLSLSSSLNMQYLDGLSEIMGDSNLWWPAGDAIQHSQVRSFLEQEGYQTIIIASGWDYTDIRDGDAFIKPYTFMLRDFQKAFISWTNLHYLGEIHWDLVSFPSENESRRVVQYAFAALPDVAKIPGPKFVFSHILSPHPPYLFDEDGEPVESKYTHPQIGSPGYFESVVQYRQAYLEQLTFISRKTLEMIDGILAQSNTPPVIILQADHGPDVFMDFDSITNTCLYERYSILNAYYLPGISSEEIPQNITPVNSFRLVFNLYFGTDVEILTNHAYFSSDLLYQFEEITDLIGVQCNLPSEALP